MNMSTVDPAHLAKFQMNTEDQPKEDATPPVIKTKRITEYPDT